MVDASPADRKGRRGVSDEGRAPIIQNQPPGLLCATDKDGLISGRIHNERGIGRGG